MTLRRTRGDVVAADRAAGRPVRVLHVLGRGLNRGGVETWLMRVLRGIDRERFRMHFLAGTDQPCAYDEEARGLGAEIIPGVSYRRPRAFVRKLRAVLRERGPWDVVHAHPAHVTGLILRVAHEEGVPVRIAHSHNDRRADYDAAGLIRRMWIGYGRRQVAAHATVGLACSAAAATSLFGERWRDDPRWRLLQYGMDPAPFAQPVDRDAVRAELGIAPDEFVVGHVGNFRPQKNHAFVVDIAAAALARRPDLRFLLVGRDVDGTGELRRSVRERAERAGVAERFIFTGERTDVPRLMTGAMDAFVLPSLWEGLGIVLIEAQAAGLACVVSDVVPAEADVVPGLLHRVELARPPAEWAQVLLGIAAGEPVSRVDALAAVRESPASIERCVAELEAIYGS